MLDERGGISGAPSSALDIASKNHLLDFQHSWSISSTVVNAAHYGYNLNSTTFDSVEPNELSVLIQGLALVGRAPNLIWGDGCSKSTHHFSDDVFMSLGKHGLKLGGQFTFESNLFRFAAFESGRAIVPEQEALSGLAPRAELFQKGSGGSQVNFAFSSIGLYFQDDYKVIPRLTLNLGLRYDAEFLPLLGKNELDGWQPRIGLAWDIKGNGRTLLRAGYGVFRSGLPQSPVGFQLLMGGQGLQTDLPSPVRGVTSFIGEQAASNAFGQFLARGNISDGPQMATTYARSSQRPIYQNVDVDIIRELWGSWRFQAGYSYRRGSHLLTETNMNLPAPTFINGRPDFRDAAINPAFAQIYQFETAGLSSYHAGALSLQGRKSFFDLRANYTFSKSIDDAPSGSFEDTPENVFDRRSERAISSWSAKHYLNLFSSVNAPKPNWRMSWLNSVVGSLYLNEIFQFRSGLHSNVLAGSDANHDGNPLTDRPVTVGRNTFLGQNYLQLDIRLGSNIRLPREGHRLNLEAKLLNVLNRTNFASYDTVLGRNDLTGLDPAIVFGRGGLPNFDFRQPLAPGGFGLATSAFSPRRIQLGVKYAF
jgi:hypothetical protein